MNLNNIPDPKDVIYTSDGVKLEVNVKTYSTTTISIKIKARYKDYDYIFSMNKDNLLRKLGLHTNTSFEDLLVLLETKSFAEINEIFSIEA